MIEIFRAEMTIEARDIVMGFMSVVPPNYVYYKKDDERKTIYPSVY